MGVAYKAGDIRLGRFVALKFLPRRALPQCPSTRAFPPGSSRRLGLNHPNICTIHDIGEQDEHALIDMELLDGVLQPG
jgi:serine/threonine protein kinase